MTTSRPGLVGSLSALRNRSQPTLYLTPSPDGGVLLDLNNDQLLKLNPVGVEMWTALVSGRERAEITAEVARRYGVTEERVASDLARLLKAAAALGLTSDCLLVTAESRPVSNPQRDLNGQLSYPWYAQDANVKRPKPERLVVVRALLELGVFDFILSCRSFRTLCQRVQNWPLNHSSACNKSDLIAKTCAAVEEACVWYPKKALCLQRSAALTCMLRSHGIAARMIVGSRAMPMIAHAWVEVDGIAVNDFARVRHLYRELTAL
jgi:hypothetical protein